MSASAGSHREQAVAIYEDDRAFLRLVRRTFLDADVVRTLERAVVIAFGPASTRTICEGLELTDEQLSLWVSGWHADSLLRTDPKCRPEKGRLLGPRRLNRMSAAARQVR